MRKHGFTKGRMRNLKKYMGKNKKITIIVIVVIIIIIIMEEEEKTKQTR